MFSGDERGVNFSPCSFFISISTVMSFYQYTDSNKFCFRELEAVADSDVMEAIVLLRLRPSCALLAFKQTS